MTALIRLPIGFVNCYLLRLGENAVLVDSANPGTQDKVLEALRSHNVAPEDLRLIFLTHNHPDHSGTAPWFREEYGIPLAMHPLDTTVGPLKTEGLPGFLLGLASRGGVESAEALVPDLALEDGFSLREYGIPGEVLHVPGHTAGSVGILLDGNRFVAGDLYMNFAGPHTAYIAEDFDRLRLSEQKLMARPVDVVFPGHGRPFRFARVAPLEVERLASTLPLKAPKQADCALPPNGEGK